MSVMVEVTVLVSTLFLFRPVPASQYSNELDSVVDESDDQPVYLPSVVGITECTYVRHFDAFSGNITCPSTAPALITVQTNAATRESSGVGPHLPHTNWSMQCECPRWSFQGRTPQPDRSAWTQFTTTHQNSSFRCRYYQFLSGLAYRYDNQSRTFTWWGRCTKFHGYYADSQSCTNSRWSLPDGANNTVTLMNQMTGFSGVDDYPIQYLQGSNLPSSASSLSSNGRVKKFKECTILQVPGCDNPTINHGSISLLQLVSFNIPDPGVPNPPDLNLESDLHRTKNYDAIKFVCDAGYYLNGSSNLSCLNGAWIPPTPPTCKPCRPINFCLAVECSNGTVSYCQQCMEYTTTFHENVPLKVVLNKNRKRCRVAPYIDREREPLVHTFRRRDTVSLRCHAVGRPSPKVQWTLPSGSTRVNQSLVIDYISDKYEGNYTCTAFNEVGSDSVNFTLVSRDAERVRKESQIFAFFGILSPFNAPTIINKAPYILRFMTATQALLHCQTTGYPSPVIKWYKLEVKYDQIFSQSVPEYGDQRIHRHTNGTLEINRLNETWDGGIYTCLAINRYGSDSMHKYICIGDSSSCNDLVS